MLVLPRPAVKQLAHRGSVDGWSPQTTRQPDLKTTHAVRHRPRGDDVLRARGRSYRVLTLEDLEYPDALAAGFKTRDDLREWFVERYGERRAPVFCWVVCYEHVAVQPLRYMVRPTTGGDYSEEPRGAIDELPAVDETTQDRYSREGWQGFALRRAEALLARDEMPLWERLREIERLAATGADVSRPLSRVRAAIEAAERRARVA